jgi:hypothetical protein
LLPHVIERLQYSPVLEDELIEKLFAFDRNYPDDLAYECFPDPGTNEFNSNSYISGLLNRADLPHPAFPFFYKYLYPGWTKPVPASEFDPHP